MLKNKSGFELTKKKDYQSQRQIKASRLIRDSIINCLRKGRGIDIRLIPMPLTITNIKISSDLKFANCYYLPFNTKLLKDDILDALKISQHIIRQYVTKEINLKYSPEIRFFYDQGFENFNRVSSLFFTK